MEPTADQVDKPSRQDHARRAPRKAHKRARRACLRCRARKVRCDFSRRGDPCTNCDLDNERCLIARRRAKPGEIQDAPEDYFQAYLSDGELMRDPETVQKENSSSAPQPAIMTEETGAFEMGDICFEDLNRAATQDTILDSPQNILEGSFDTHPLDASPETLLTDYSSVPLRKSSRPSTGLEPITGEILISSEVVYCYYSFLASTNIHQIPQADFSFLELQGCLKVPVRPLLDEFIQQYFLHVHPTLPVVNEGDFWDIYDNADKHSPKEPIPLLLLQAMLFAASAFVTPYTSLSLGYPDLQSMRATLLRRAKLLYDLQSETSPFIIAQASILLSTASLLPSGKLNTIWLALAIENAKLAEAHLYKASAPASHTKQQNLLKRLWWCCIIRDRSVGLLLKRPVQITKDHFNFSDDFLHSNDLEDEFQRSRVYDPLTKSKLAEILSQTILLFIKLTDIITLLYPPQGKQPSTQQEHHESLLRLYRCKSDLRNWYLVAVSRLQDRQGPADLEALLQIEKPSRHESVTLYRNLMFMYYHTARINLCHHEALCLVAGGPGMTLPFARGPLRISETRRELQDAVSDVTKCHKELLRLELTQWIPYSAMGFSILPFLLTLLDSELSPPVMDSLQQSYIATQYQLSVFSEFMTTYGARYEGIDWITAIIRHIVNLAQLNKSRLQKMNLGINWAGIFTFRPGLYLRLVLGLDMSLSRGRLAHDADFPVKLRGLLSLSLNSVEERVEGRGLSARSSDLLSRWTSHSSAAKSVLHDQNDSQTIELSSCLCDTLGTDNSLDPLLETTSEHDDQTGGSPN